MSDPMALDGLVSDLKTSLTDTASKFQTPDDGDFKRFLQLALPDMAWKRPLTRLGQVDLVAGSPRYALSNVDGFFSLKSHIWGAGVSLPKPWDDGHPGAMPRVQAQRDEGSFWLDFDPAPTCAQIALFGSVFKFYYLANHSISAETGDGTTVLPADRGLLLLRAQAEAMKELAIRNVSKPVQMRDGMTSAPRNSTPTALHQSLLQQFQEAH